MPTDILVIAGPTASGKSTLSLALAERLGGEIVNADAMQVYRDLRILTARPGEDDEARAVHHLYGHVDAGARHSAGLWANEARGVIDGILERRARAVVVGGSGLYLHALLFGLSEMPDPGAEARAHASRIAERDGLDALRAAAMAADPEATAAVEPGDRQRLERILSVATGTGRALSDWRRDEPSSPLGRDAWSGVVLDPGREALAARIAMRAAAMLDEGGIEEAAALLARDLDPQLPAMKAIGVAEAGELLAGRRSRAETIDAIRIATRRYAKRQRTWIRGRQADWARISDAADVGGAICALSREPS